MFYIINALNLNDSKMRLNQIFWIYNNKYNNIKQ